MTASDCKDYVGRLLDMEPDTIARFVLLKDFTDISPDDSEYQELYRQVCEHKFVRTIEDSQNERGFWPPFHGYTEGMIRRLLSFGLGGEHSALKAVTDYLGKVLKGEEQWDQFEKQDNPLWYPKMFVPLVSAAMLSLIDRENPLLDGQRRLWSYIARSSFEDGVYSPERLAEASAECFGFSTKRAIPPFNYYVLLLLAPNSSHSYLDTDTDRDLVDFCMKDAGGICYVYNNPPGEMVEISACNRDSRDFWHWVRALSIISNFHGWDAYRDKYCDHIMSQANSAGLWEFPKKFDFSLSNSWRGKNKMIDSSVYVLRMLSGMRGF